MAIGTARRDRLRKRANRIRAIPGERFGLRTYSVSVQVVSHSGTYGLQGTESSTSYAITEANGQPPKVRFLNDEELALGGLGKGTIRVGPITPDYSGGGNAIADILADPDNTDIVEYTVTGPEFPNGSKFRRVGIDSDRALHYTLTLAPISTS